MGALNMPINPNEVVWDTPDPNAVKWDNEPAAQSPLMKSPAFQAAVRASLPFARLPQQITNIVGGAVRGTTTAPLAVSQWTGMQTPEQVAERKAAIDEALATVIGVRPDQYSYEAGQMIPQAVGFGGAGRVLGLGARSLNAPRVAAALETGGLSKDVGGIGTRIAAGAGTGGTLNYLLSDPTAAGFYTGVAAGGAMPILGLLGSKAVEGVSTLQDIIQKNIGKVRAGQLLRESLNAFSPTAVRTASVAGQNAPENVLASEALADVLNPTTQSLLRTAEEVDPANFATYWRQAQKEGDIATLRNLAQGATQTEARAGREASKGTLSAITAPMRERPLELANIGGTRGAALQKEAEQASAASRLAVEDVRRFTAAGGRAEELARTWEPSTGATFAGQPRPPTAATYPGELAQRAEQVATRRAGESLTAGEARREAETRLASLKAAGLEPLTVTNVRAAIRKQLASPDVISNPDAVKALTGVDKLLEQFADANGVIRSEAMYAVRKNGINAIIDQFARDMDPSARKKFALDISAKLKPLIDDAIEAAGGKGWSDYLKTFEKGMADIERRELSAKALELYRKNPTQFQELVSNENPDAVEAILGPGSYDFLQEMGGPGQKMYEIGQRLAREAKVSQAATEGASAAAALARKQQGKLATFVPNVFSRKATILKSALTGLEGRIEQKTMQALIDASRSGQAFNEVLNTLPAKDREQVYSYILRNPELRKNVSPVALTAINNLVNKGRSVMTNAFAPSTNNNALAEQ